MNVVRYLAIPAIAGALLLSTVGCMNEHRSDIPTTATLAVEGNGLMQYTAPSDGRVWVYDVPADRTVYSSHVSKGDSVILDRNLNRVMVGGRVVVDKDVQNADMTRIYFQPDYGTEGTVTHSTYEQHSETIHNP